MVRESMSHKSSKKCEDLLIISSKDYKNNRLSPHTFYDHYLLECLKTSQYVLFLISSLSCRTDWNFALNHNRSNKPFCHMFVHYVCTNYVHYLLTRSIILERLICLSCPFPGVFLSLLLFYAKAFLHLHRRS